MSTEIVVISDTHLQEWHDVQIDPLTAHDSYGAWREKEHDDLVLAVALACWYGERGHRFKVW